MIGTTNAISASTLPGIIPQAAASARSVNLAELERPDPPKAPFISPRVRVDTALDKAILEIRDSDTGEVIDTFPSESQLRAFARADQADNTLTEPVSQLAVGEGEGAQTIAVPSIEASDLQAQPQTQEVQQANPQSVEAAATSVLV